jgi:L-malate glycosyltransferase
VRILYVNQTAEMSGGERSLLYLLSVLPPAVTATVACPTGPLTLAVRRLGVPVSTIPAVRGSLRLHPWHTPSSLVAISHAALAIRRHALDTGADLVHANSIRAGLAAVLAARYGGPPAIVHVRDCLPMTRAAMTVRQVLGASAAMIFANSRYTADNFTAAGSRAPVVVVHNPVDLSRFDPSRTGRGEVREKLGLDRSATLLGVVAQITPWKGQEDAIRALAILRRRRPAQLLLIGEAKFGGGQSRYDTNGYLTLLRRLVQELGLAEAVHFLGERRDIPEILRGLDLLLVPSWEEPFGNVAIEAMAMETPVVASNVGGLIEIVRQGEDGLLLPPRQPERWAESIDWLLAQPELRATMGRSGRRRAEADFGEKRYLDTVLAGYQAALARHTAGRKAQRTGPSGSARLRLHRIQRPLALLYHGVCALPSGADRSERSLCLDPEMFSWQMADLARRGYRTLSLEAYLAALEGARPPARSVLLTFDDAYAHLDETVSPILRRHSFTAVVFAPWQHLGTHNTWDAHLGNLFRLRIADAKQLLEMDRGPWEVASHGLRHVDLRTLEPDQRRAELREARERLADLLGRPVLALAYPYGDHDHAVRRDAQAAGYRMAFTVDRKDSLDPYQLPRRMVAGNEDKAIFRLKTYRQTYPWFESSLRTARNWTGPARAAIRGAHR